MCKCYVAKINASQRFLQVWNLLLPHLAKLFATPIPTGGRQMMKSFTYRWAGIAQSVERLAAGLSVRESNSGGGEIFRTRPILGTTPSPIHGTPDYSRGQNSLDLASTIHHHEATRLKKE
jgi:hypothetical protein